MKKLLMIIGVTIGLTIRTFAGPIHDAARNGDIDAVQAELDKGVDVDTDDRPGGYGITPLYLAAERGHKKIVELLIEKGADLEAKNYFRGSSALHNGGTAVFAAVNNKELMTLLIAAGADLNATTDYSRETVLHTLAKQIESESIMELVINNGGNVNAITALYTSEKNQKGAGTPTDIALSNKNFAIAELLQKYGGKTTGEVIESLLNKTIALEKLISDKHKGDTTNPTDEWPRKMWEADLGENVTVLQPVLIGNDETSLLLFGSKKWFWASGDGKLIEIPYIGKISSRLSKVIPHIHYFDSDNLVISNFGNTSVIMYSRLGDEIIRKKHDSLAIRFPEATSKEIPNTSHIGITKKAGTNKFICWDFRPPSSTSPAPDGGNNGSNETANSRIIIKTDGPDIALATDGTLGVAELQKSNDLRSWRKLGDVPAEANEVLLTPRETGNEFFRLKKKE
jgi:ankyrin repeat protein